MSVTVSALFALLRESMQFFKDFSSSIKSGSDLVEAAKSLYLGRKPELKPCDCTNSKWGGRAMRLTNTSDMDVIFTVLGVSSCNVGVVPSIEGIGAFIAAPDNKDLIEQLFSGHRVRVKPGQSHEFPMHVGSSEDDSEKVKFTLSWFDGKGKSRKSTYDFFVAALKH